MGLPKKNPGEHGHQVLLSTRTKAQSSQVQGFRSAVVRAEWLLRLVEFPPLLGCTNTPVWGQLDSYWLVNSGDDMCHQISFDPTDNTCFHVCHLEKLWKLWVCGATNSVNHISHPLITVVFNNHCHASFDVRKQRVSIGP